MNEVYTICYDNLDVFKDKESATEFYNICYQSSDGAEKERYGSILIDLMFNDIGKDSITSECNKIYMFIGKDYQETPLKYILKDWMSIEETIKLYKDKLKTIIDVSNDYGINFHNSTPFEFFGDDNESYNMSSFSDYYKDIIERYNIKVDSIKTDSKSDGKYELLINNELTIDIRAWDDFTSLVDNIETVLEYYKTKDIER